MSLVPSVVDLYWWIEGIQSVNQTVTSGSAFQFTVSMPSSGSCFKTIDKVLFLLDYVRATGSSVTGPTSITLQFPSGSQTQYISAQVGNYKSQLCYDITNYLNAPNFNRLVSGSVNCNGPTSIYIDSIKMEMLVLEAE